MTTKSVKDYNSIFEELAKKLITKIIDNQDSNNSNHHLNQANSVISFLIEKNHNKKDIDKLALRTFGLIMNRYIPMDSGYLCWGTIPRHRDLGIHLRNFCLDGEFNKNSIKQFVSTLEESVLGKKCNLKGNFANICRTIVNKTENLGGWSFSKEFKEKLDIEIISSECESSPKPAMS
jgi:hypothetical protein